MSGLWSILWSSVGKKVVTAITGLAMIVFLIGHLAGNLTLLTGKDETYNAYSHFLLNMGALLIVVELGLLAFFILHVVDGVLVWLGKRKARPERYEKSGSAGGPSRKTLSSKTMIWTGLVLLVFTVVHLKTFKYGPGVEEGYSVEIDGVVMRDLYGLVVDKFSHPGYVAFYVGCMVLMGFHLRHGFWSAFQSLGALTPRHTPLIYGLGVLVAIALAAGFLILPLWLFFMGGGS